MTRIASGARKDISSVAAPTIIYQLNYSHPLFIIVWDIIRDSAFGHLVRLAGRGKFFRYAEENDSTLWKKFIDEEKSSNIEKYGNTIASDTALERQRINIRSSDSRTSSQGVPVDLEKGKHKYVVN